eukprot:gnl/TRDRNA2_/TRDRNA2_118624_c0_seq1.p1 gnl/TRDRNA2_/TRDRNA2_118624_c0~~gnl/TRDRNA2_/TRDRNA2_118624_c0_seq1.p1  ORF type:complete len:256 (-),score=19.48 gnl/TRDRNA2_/TRDRNA2_118624_c0_seq1:28-735(-)
MVARAAHGPRPRLRWLDVRGAGKGYKPLCFRRVVLPMRACGGSILPATWFSEAVCSEGNLLVRHVRMFMLDAFAIGINTSTGSVSTVLLVERRKRERQFADIEAIVVALKSMPRLPSLKRVDFAAHSFQDQIWFVRQSQVMVGMRGAGMTHLLWLPEGAGIVDIARVQPPVLGETSQANVLMNLARWANIRYRWVAATQAQDGMYNVDPQGMDGMYNVDPQGVCAAVESLLPPPN